MFTSVNAYLTWESQGPAADHTTADFARSIPRPVHAAVVVHIVGRSRWAGHSLAASSPADRTGAAGRSPAEEGSHPGCNNPGSGCTEQTLL